MKKLKQLSLIMPVVCLGTFLFYSCDDPKESAPGGDTGYSVEISADEGGSALATIDEETVTRAPSGATVRVTATPAADHKFTGWTTDAGRVVMADRTAATTTFVMPKENVALRAGFAPIVAHRITFADVEGGSAVAKAAGSEAREATEGTLITITATPDTGWQFVDWTITGGGIELADATAPETTFTMPDTPVSITPAFSRITFPINVEASESGSATITVDGVEATTAIVGATVTVEATPNEGMRFTGWTVAGGSVELDDPSLVSTTFTMPAEEVTLGMSFEAILYKINVVQPANGNVVARFSLQELATEAKKGTNVTIIATPDPKYAFSRWDVSGNVRVHNSSASTTAFTMPAGDVTISAVFSDDYHNITLMVIDGKAEARVDGYKVTRAITGSLVEISAISTYGYPFSGWSVYLGAVDLEDPSSPTTTFIMPDENVTITAAFGM